MQYIIRFYPVEGFFFGGEITFGNRENANYLVKSNLFPQQTTILGTLRKELLIQKGYLKMTASGYRLSGNTAEIEGLIGKESFDISSTSIQSFGVIKEISPVFISNGDNHYVPAPMDHGLSFKEYPGRSCLIREDNNFIPIIEGYNPKDGLKGGLINPSDNSIKEFDKIFIPDKKVGITKGRGGPTPEKAFYKQTAYRLAEKYHFAVIARIDWDIKGSMVFMGAERSAFRMEVEDADGTDFSGIFSPLKDARRLLLLSDAYVEEDIFKDCKFAITDTVSFRNIKSRTRDYKFRKEGRLRTFLKSGSAFFPKQGRANNIIDGLGRPNLRAIGYNIIL